MSPFYYVSYLFKQINNKKTRKHWVWTNLPCVIMSLHHKYHSFKHNIKYDSIVIVLLRWTWQSDMKMYVGCLLWCSQHTQIHTKNTHTHSHTHTHAIIIYVFRPWESHEHRRCVCSHVHVLLCCMFCKRTNSRINITANTFHFSRKCSDRTTTTRDVIATDKSRESN